MDNVRKGLLPVAPSSFIDKFLTFHSHLKVCGVEKSQVDRSLV